ncbi:AraC family transcriptional regulator [Enterococcus casseliflavus]|uniref:AraC family transcriptional regulator n=1 Tax=Enterococcus casseliflavus TaxID=37734 RepID=UPI00163DB3F8|nr:GyrI-like domain-containing protein [Enterococcus casseliflavus]
MKGTLTMEIKELPEAKLIFMRRTGAYGPENQQLIETLKAWLKEKDLFNETTIILGIAQDNPETTVPENCRYDVGIVVNEFKKFDDPRILQTVIQAGKYALFIVDHTAQVVTDFWRKLANELNESNITLDISRPIIERYQYKMVMNHLCEFCVPIQ